MWEQKVEPAGVKSSLKREERLAPFLTERGKTFFSFLLYKWWPTLLHVAASFCEAAFQMNSTQICSMRNRTEQSYLPVTVRMLHVWLRQACQGITGIHYLAPRNMLLRTLQMGAPSPFAGWWYPSNALLGKERCDRYKLHQPVEMLIVNQQPLYFQVRGISVCN